jgi:hypothetical protein
LQDHFPTIPAALSSAFHPNLNQKGIHAMSKFMSSHSVPPGAIKREQVNQLADAARNDPVVHPYRSFLNLSEGKMFCVMEAPDKDTLAAWFRKMEMPCDSITPVELEGVRGMVEEV